MIRFSCGPALRFTAVLTLSALAGCSDQGPQDELLRHVERARERWNAARPDRYAYDLLRICECTPEMTGPVTVLVEGIAPAGWSYPDGSPVAMELRSSFPSVDGLLDIVEDAIRGNAWEVTVQYDQETGVPIELRIDYEPLVFDEEAYYRVVVMPRVPDA